MAVSVEPVLLHATPGTMSNAPLVAKVASLVVFDAPSVVNPVVIIADVTAELALGAARPKIKYCNE